MARRTGTPNINHVGKRHRNRRGCWYTVVEKTAEKRYGYRVYRIVFDSGYEVLVNAVRLHQNKIRDALTPTLTLGKAWPGDRIKCYSKHPLYDTWVGILSRTIGTKKTKYYEDVTVCDRWLRFDNFVEDAEKLPGYDASRLHELTIDKDKLGTRLGRREYGPETCCWLTPQEQAIYRRRLAKTKAPQCPYRGVHFTDDLWLARPTIAGHRHYLGSFKIPLQAAFTILYQFPDYYTEEEKAVIRADACQKRERVEAPDTPKAA